MGQTRPLFVYFRPFHNTMTIIAQILTINEIKAQMVCLGFKTGAAGWQAQTDPLSYGGTPFLSHITYKSFAFFFSLFSQAILKLIDQGAQYHSFQVIHGQIDSNELPIWPSILQQLSKELLVAISKLQYKRFLSNVFPLQEVESLESGFHRSSKK